MTWQNPGAFDADAEGEGGPVLSLTTAIAIGSQVVRFESQLDAAADGTTISRFIYAGRNFTADELPDLDGAPLPPMSSR